MPDRERKRVVVVGGGPAGLSAADQHTGATPGGTATYSFHATRPGTFLYEAGHTANGARQVAMGLAGALVVLPADGTAAGHTYDDESVVVLSDLDPRLNADPTGFDMRNFRARWRLLNGKPFPSTSPIATDQGRIDVADFFHPTSIVFTPQSQKADWAAEDAALEPIAIEPDEPVIGKGYGNEAAEVGRCLRAGLLESPLVPHAQTLTLMRQMEELRRLTGIRYPGE